MATLAELRQQVESINSTYKSFAGTDLQDLSGKDIGSLGTDALQNIIDTYGQAATMAKQAAQTTGGVGLVGGLRNVIGPRVTGTGNISADMKTAWNTGVINTSEGLSEPSIGTPITPTTPTATTPTAPGTTPLPGTTEAVNGALPERPEWSQYSEFYKEPTVDAAQVALYTPLLGTKAKAEAYVRQQAEAAALADAKAQYETSNKELDLKQFISQFPEQQKGIREALAKELTGYESDLYKELLPQTMQTMAARGLSGGTLDQAIAQSQAKLAREREMTLSNMGTQSALAASQLEYENALRQAQTAGLKGSSLEDYYRQLGAQTQSQGYQAGQSNLQRSFQEQQNNLAYQRALEAEARENAYNEKAMANQSWGNLYGTGLRGLIGAGIGLATGGLSTAATGGLMGLTGQYLPKNWYMP